jgi:hypothetical protein
MLTSDSTQGQIVTGWITSIEKSGIEPKHVGDKFLLTFMKFCLNTWL